MEDHIPNPFYDFGYADLYAMYEQYWDQIRSQRRANSAGGLSSAGRFLELVRYCQHQQNAWHDLQRQVHSLPDLSRTVSRLSQNLEITCDHARSLQAAYSILEDEHIQNKTKEFETLRDNRISEHKTRLHGGLAQLEARLKQKLEKRQKEREENEEKGRLRHSDEQAFVDFDSLLSLPRHPEPELQLPEKPQPPTPPEEHEEIQFQTHENQVGVSDVPAAQVRRDSRASNLSQNELDEPLLQGPENTIILDPEEAPNSKREPHEQTLLLGQHNHSEEKSDATQDLQEVNSDVKTSGSASDLDTPECVKEKITISYKPFGEGCTTAWDFLNTLAEECEFEPVGIEKISDTFEEQKSLVVLTLVDESSASVWSWSQIEEIVAMYQTRRPIILICLNTASNTIAKNEFPNFSGECFTLAVEKTEKGVQIKDNSKNGAVGRGIIDSLQKEHGRE